MVVDDILNKVKKRTGDPFADNFKLTNDMTFLYYFRRLFRLASTRFLTQGLPDNIDPAFYAQKRTETGAICIFRDDVSGLIWALPFVEEGIDLQGNPTSWTAWGENGMKYPGLNADNSVIVWDTYMHGASICPDLMMFAKRLEVIERTMDLNIEGQKTPYILQGTKTQIESLKQTYSELAENVPYIVLDKALNPQEAIVSMTTTPFIAGELQVIKRNIWNEAMTFLGIENANSEKKERLVTQEATGMQGVIDNELIGTLKSIRECEEKANKMFGLELDTVIAVDAIREELGYEVDGANGTDEVPEIEREVRE